MLHCCRDNQIVLDSGSQVWRVSLLYMHREFHRPIGLVSFWGIFPKVAYKRKCSVKKSIENCTNQENSISQLHHLVCICLMEALEGRERWTHMIQCAVYWHGYISCKGGGFSLDSAVWYWKFDSRIEDTPPPKSPIMSMHLLLSGNLNASLTGPRFPGKDLSAPWIRPRPN